MKAKSTIYEKIFFGETLSGLCIEIDTTMYIKELFWITSSKEHQMFFFKGNIKFSMRIHSLKVNKKNMKTNYDICSKLIIKKLERIWAAKS